MAKEIKETKGKEELIEIVDELRKEREKIERKIKYWNDRLMAVMETEAKDQIKDIRQKPMDQWTNADWEYLLTIEGQTTAQYEFRKNIHPTLFSNYWPETNQTCILISSYTVGRDTTFKIGKKQIHAEDTIDLILKILPHIKPITKYSELHYRDAPKGPCKILMVMPQDSDQGFNYIFIDETGQCSYARSRYDSHPMVTKSLREMIQYLKDAEII